MRRLPLSTAQRRFAYLPVVAGLLLLVGLPRVLSHGVAQATVVEDRVAGLREAFANAPFQIGDWTGEDVPVPTAAIEMLRPTAILSRRYRNLRDGRTASMLIVQCSDARDMGSHYPPVCYPAQGWIMSEVSRDEPWVVPLGGEDIPLRCYDFVRSSGPAETSRLRVLNCFVQSNGVVTAVRPETNHLLERQQRSARGIAQIQVVISGGMDKRASHDTAAELLAGHASLISSLARGGATP